MDDLISRQAAIDALGERPLTWTGGDYELGCRNQYDTDRLAIETVPSAEPERIRGRWIDDGSELGCCCPECGKTLDEYFDGGTEIRLLEIPHFCPNCGADMRDKEDEE